MGFPKKTPDPYFSDIQPIQILQTSEQWTAGGAEAAIQSEMALGTFFFSQHWQFESSNVSSQPRRFRGVGCSGVLEGASTLRYRSIDICRIATLARL